jgi:hypothetical protein
MSDIKKRPGLSPKKPISPQSEQKNGRKDMWGLPDPPPLWWWRAFGLLSALSIIPYVYVIKKNTLNWWLVVIISLNPLVRYFFPSQYVPAKHHINSWISHPFLARFLATIAEPIFLWAEAMCIGVPYWSGPMGILTIAGETISWVHLIFQSELIGVIEDSTWVLVQVAALLTGSGIFTR